VHRIAKIRRVLIITFLLNIFVAGAKILYGYLTNSVAILSDGFHSLFDGASNILGLIGIYISAHPPDETHPYGHRKYETVFTILIGVLMFVTCLEIFKEVYASFMGNKKPDVDAQSFVIMLITLSVNIFVATYEKSMGEKLNSEFLIADSQHTKSDIYVSVGVIVSLIFIALGFPIADPIAGMVVGLLVARAGINIIRDSMEILVDRTQTDIEIIRDIVCNVEGVAGCHEIRTRGAKSHVFIDIHVLVEPSMSVLDAHMIADTVEKELKSKIPQVVDVIVHIEPAS
jgi:cation diffusion facilitator family transporter